MKILVLNGPNLNMLGSRDKNQYGNAVLSELQDGLEKEFPEVSFTFLQSNNENDLVTAVQTALVSFDGLLLNPGGLSHSSVSLRDALEVCPLPKVEVHLSNIVARDDFRRISLTAQKCDGCVSGLKEISYLSGAFALLKLIEKSKHGYKSGIH